MLQDKDEGSAPQTTDPGTETNADAVDAQVMA